MLDVVAGRFPGCGLRHEEGEGGGGGGEGGGEGEVEEEAGRGRRREARASDNGGGEKSDHEEKTLGASITGVGGVPPPCSNIGGKKDHLSSLRTARPYQTLGGVLAAEAIALLKEFYETGNPSAPRPNRPAAAAATRAARKAAAAEAAAAAVALADRAAAAAAAASNGDCGAAT